MFRKLTKTPISVVLTELNLKGFTGFISIVGNTDSGYARIDVDFLNGLPSYCSASIEDGPLLKGNKCLSMVMETICGECFAEIIELPQSKIRRDTEEFTLMNEMASIYSIKGGSLLNVIEGSELDAASKYLTNSAIISNLAKSSKTVSIMNSSMSRLIKILVSISCKHPLLLSGEGENVKVMAIAKDRKLVALCIWEGQTPICGNDALKHGFLLSEEEPLVNGIIYYIDTSLILTPLKKFLSIDQPKHQGNNPAV